MIRQDTEIKLDRQKNTNCQYLTLVPNFLYLTDTLYSGNQQVTETKLVRDFYRRYVGITFAGLDMNEDVI